MNRISMVLIAVVLAGSAAARPGQEQKAKEVHAAGCVQAGIEVRCLVLRDVKSGKLYNVLIKDPRPAIGDGIEFTAVPFEGMTYCMQGTPVLVTSWARKDSLKCTPGEAPRN